MASDRYYVVLDFMASELQLKGLERDVYAIIYGFCQAGKSYTGSLQYLADWTLTTKPGVIKVLKKLEEKGLLIKEETFINGVKFNEYRAVRPTVNPGKLSLQDEKLTPVNSVYGVVNSVNPPVNSVNGDGKLSLPNSKDIKQTINKNINKPTADLFSDFIFDRATKEELAEAIEDFKDMRKKIRKPLTDRALAGIIKRLREFSNGNGDEAIEILDNSIRNGWQDVYELKSAPARPIKQAAANNDSEYPF